MAEFGEISDAAMGSPVFDDGRSLRRGETTDTLQLSGRVVIHVDPAVVDGEVFHNGKKLLVGTRGAASDHLVDGLQPLRSGAAGRCGKLRRVAGSTDAFKGSLRRVRGRRLRMSDNCRQQDDRNRAEAARTCHPSLATRAV